MGEAFFSFPIPNIYPHTHMPPRKHMKDKMQTFIADAQPPIFTRTSHTEIPSIRHHSPTSIQSNMPQWIQVQ